MNEEILAKLDEIIDDCFNLRMSHLYNSLNKNYKSTFYFNSKAIDKLESIRDDIKRDIRLRLTKEVGFKR